MPGETSRLKIAPTGVLEGSTHSGLGPGIPEPSEGIPVQEISGHRIPSGQQVVGHSVLGGLHHEYRLEKVAA